MAAGIACLLAALLALAPAAGASSSSVAGISYVKAKGTGKPQAHALARAPCGAKHAAAGGFAAGLDPLKAFAAGIAPFDSPKDADTKLDDGFKAIVDATVGSPFSVWAVCIRRGLAYDQEPFGPSSGFTTVLRPCDDGGFALGGGVTTTAKPRGAYLVGSIPTMSEWQVALDSGMNSIGFFEYRACVSDPLPITIAHDSVSVPDGASRSLLVRCQGRQHIIGGGAAANSQQTYLLASRPADLADRDRAPDDGWRGTLANRSGSPQTLGVVAFCLKPA